MSHSHDALNQEKLPSSIMPRPYISQISSSNNAPSVHYMSLPTNYSGDRWHVGIAMALDPSLKLVLIGKRDVQSNADSRYIKIGKQTKELISALIGEDDFKNRSKRLHLDPNIQMVSKKTINKKFKEFIDAEIKDKTEQEKINIKMNAKSQYASTSIIMHVMETKGVEPVLNQIKQLFSQAAERLPTDRKQAIEARLEPLKEVEQCVLVNMRCAHYNLEHNITLPILNQIQEVSNAQGVTVVPVGIYDYVNPGHRKHEEWLQKIDGLDIYGVRKHIQGQSLENNDIETAYFWLRLAEKYGEKVKGYLGGRSGSTDIAAFLGIRTLSWDKLNCEDPQFVRLLLSFPIMSIGTLNENSQLLEKEALSHWLSGKNIIPNITHKIKEAVFSQVEFNESQLSYMNNFRVVANNEVVSQLQAISSSSSVDISTSADSHENPVIAAAIAVTLSPPLESSASSSQGKKRPISDDDEPEKKSKEELTTASSSTIAPNSLSPRGSSTHMPYTPIASTGIGTQQPISGQSKDIIDDKDTVNNNQGITNNTDDAPSVTFRRI